MQRSRIRPLPKKKKSLEMSKTGEIGEDKKEHNSHQFQDRA